MQQPIGDYFKWNIIFNQEYNITLYYYKYYIRVYSKNNYKRLTLEYIDSNVTKHIVKSKWSHKNCIYNDIVKHIRKCDGCGYLQFDTNNKLCNFCSPHQYYNLQQECNCLICLETINTNLHIPFVCDISGCEYKLHVKCFRNYCCFIYDNLTPLPLNWNYNYIINDIPLLDEYTPIHKCLICKHYSIHKC